MVCQCILFLRTHCILLTSSQRQIDNGMKADSIDHGPSYNFPALKRSPAQSPSTVYTSMSVVGGLPLAVRLCVGIQVIS